jgi:hypothetical protein
MEARSRTLRRSVTWRARSGGSPPVPSGPGPSRTAAGHGPLPRVRPTCLTLALAGTARGSLRAEDAAAPSVSAAYHEQRSSAKTLRTLDRRMGDQHQPVHRRCGNDHGLGGRPAAETRADDCQSRCARRAQVLDRPQDIQMQAVQPGAPHPCVSPPPQVDREHAEPGIGKHARLLRPAPAVEAAPQARAGRHVHRFRTRPL